MDVLNKNETQITSSIQTEQHELDLIYDRKKYICNNNNKASKNRLLLFL